MPEQFALALEQVKATPAYADIVEVHAYDDTPFLISTLYVSKAYGKALADFGHESTEDLSRHNALDKAVGCALLDGLPLWECLLYSSGRVPQNMLQKGLTAGLRVFVAKAIPTWQSVQLARANGIVLICDARNKSYIRISPEE